MQRIPRRRFTGELKSRAVALAESIGPTKVGRQLGVSGKTLANCLVTARSGEPISFPSRGQVGKFENELARLRAENAALKMDPMGFKSKRRRSLPRSSSEVRLCRACTG